MAQYKNATKGVMNVAGTVVAPGGTVDASESHPGVKRAIKRGSLVKAANAAQASTSSQTNDAEAARKAELIKQIEDLTGNKPSGNSRVDTLEAKLKEAQDEDAKKKAAENGGNGAQQ